MPRTGNRPASLPSVEETQDLLARLAEVRANLNDVDRTIAEDTGPKTDRGGRHRRHRFGFDLRLLLIPLVLMLVLAVAAGMLLTRSSGAQAPASPAAHPTATLPPEPTPAAGSTPVPTPRPALAWPGTTSGLPAGLPATGPGVTEPGEEVTVAPGLGRALEVYERVVLPAGSAAARLVAPDLATVPSLRLGGAVWVRDLEVTADGQPARAVWEDDGWTIRPAVPGRTTYRSFTARYRLAGAVLLQEPAAEGRALLVVTPLWAGQARTAGVPVLARADARVTVRNATCPAAGPGSELCATPVGTSFVGVLPPTSRAAVVLLQADLR